MCSCTLPLTRFSTTKGDGTKSSIYFVKSRCSFSYPIPNFVEINIQMPNYRPNLNDIGNCPYRLRSTYASILSQPSISRPPAAPKQAIRTSNSYINFIESAVMTQLQPVSSSSNQFQAVFHPVPAKLILCKQCRMEIKIEHMNNPSFNALSSVKISI